MSENSTNTTEDLMVRAGISLDDHTHCYVFARGTESTLRYRYEVLEPYVCLYLGPVGLDLLLRNDNARHIETFRSTNFWKATIFAEWIGQLDLQASSI
ncbi:hypothetical protein TNCV_3239441 [Trichonephila clavipes]|nr:hypothetical protein TNCV_3239441 [Trichonephila clavipes]